LSINSGQLNADLVYLKPEIKIEPLVCRFYAWPFLISPAQLALNIAFRLIPLLQSFTTNPSVHIAANSDPKLYGGPFVDLSMDDVARVRKLTEEMGEDCADLIKFAKDIRSLDALLHEKANGFSLNEFYNQLPESLQGLVELLYDISHRPSIRLFEEFLYDENMSSHTQEVMLVPAGECDRPFFMSTPRFDSPESISFKMPFSDKKLDLLASMRTKAHSLADVIEKFEVADQNLEVFKNFFTAEAPPSKGEQFYSGDGVRVRYFGHACVLIQTSETSILFDPIVALESADDNRLTFADLPDHIDYVVLTHSHQDHCCPEMLIQLRHRIGRIVVPRNNSGCITDPSMKLLLEQLGYDHIDALDISESVSIPDGEILSIPFTGEHCDLNIYSKQAILLTVKDRKFMFLVDSDGRDIGLYRRMMRKFKSVDALFLGMECHGAPLTWLYEPLLSKPVNRRVNESRRLSGADCERAWNITKEVNPPKVFVYAMGQEPWMQYLMGLQYSSDSIQLIESDKFIERCDAAGIQGERLFGAREMLF
jgi:L-ascorbate metabolism protein UlaG (beta-lactamase superfamily)